MCKCCALFVFCKLIILFATFLLTHLEYSKDIYQALTSLLVLSSFPLFFFCFCIQAVGYPDQLKHLFSCSLRANSIKCILQLDTSLFFKIPHPHPPTHPLFSHDCALVIFVLIQVYQPPLFYCSRTLQGNRAVLQFSFVYSNQCRGSRWASTE